MVPMSSLQADFTVAYLDCDVLIQTTVACEIFMVLLVQLGAGGAIAAVVVDPGRLDGGDWEHEHRHGRPGAGAAVTHGSLVCRPEPLQLLNMSSLSRLARCYQP